jgi:hypothetical protein
MVYPIRGKIIEVLRTSTITKIEVEIPENRFVQAYPGCYFNIFFPGIRGSMRSYSAVAFWLPPEGLNIPSTKLSNLHFLLSEGSRLSKTMSTSETDDKMKGELIRNNNVRLEGPFGKKLGLQGYANVILVANGIGIVGVLPYALVLAGRRQHDDSVRTSIQEVTQKLKSLSGTPSENRSETRNNLMEKLARLKATPLFRDAVKKLIIFWWLESPSQMELVKTEFQKIQILDPENVS